MHHSQTDQAALNSPQTPKKVLIVDDHPLVRDALSTRISAEKDLMVCGEAATEDEAVLLVKQLNPDLVIIDITLKLGHGMNVIKRVKSLSPSVKMLVFSGYSESLYAERALRAGARGYVSKQDSSEKLLEAIRAILAGGRYVSSEITQRLLSHALGATDSTKTPIACLTDREMEILHLIGEGLSTRVIADRLFLSTHTIDSHRNHIKRKLGINDGNQLTRFAVQWVLENG